METPVLLVAFNRPESTRLVFDVLREVKPTVLYVAVDGPRAGVPGEEALCAEVQKIAAGADWSCDLHTLFRDRNLGCQRAVSGALDWFFNRVEAGIILEDDCVPHESFFPYCSDLLARYCDDERVMMLTGTNYQIVPADYPYAYFFSTYYPIWGWATWRRAWSLYQPTMPSWPAHRGANELVALLGSEENAKLYRRFFDLVHYGRLDTWDIQWAYTCLFQHGLCVIPKHNLVSNVGDMGTHARGGGPFQRMPTFEIDWKKMVHPREVFPDRILNAALFHLVIGEHGGSGITLTTRLRAAVGRSYRLARRLGGRGKNALDSILFPPPKVPQLVELKGRHPERGRTLLSYLKDGVLLEENASSFQGHSNLWESREVACILSRFGYTVDAVDFRDSSFVPARPYDIIVDIHSNLQRLIPFLPAHSLKLLHMTGSYPEYSNRKELERVQALEKRKGVVYSPKRIADTILFNRSLRLADRCSLIGNEWTLTTYPEEFRSKISLVTVSASTVAAVKQRQEFFRDGRLDFLWFFGSGAVHKGLDLTLEAFALEPDSRLHVIGGAAEETDFVRIYERELFRCPNIEYHGHLNPGSVEFAKILDSCCCFVAPTCSEGISPAVATLLQVGLYPIITRDTGVTLPEGCGLYLDDISVDGIRCLIHKVRETSFAALEAEVQEIQRDALSSYSRGAFARRFTDYLKGEIQRAGMI